MNRTIPATKSTFLISTLAATMLAVGACDVPPIDDGAANPQGASNARPGDQAEVERVTSALQLDSGIPLGAHGGNGGGGFCPWYAIRCLDSSGLLRPFDFQARGRLAELRIWSGKFIDGIEVTWQDVNDPSHLIHSEHAGGWGGSMKRFTMDPGEFITRIDGMSGWFIDRLQITTNMGRTMVWGSVNSGASVWNVGIPGEEIHGMTGAGGKYVDNINFFSYLP